MGRWLVVVAALVILFVVIALYVRLRDNASTDTAPVERGQLEVVIETVGRLSPQEAATVHAEASGRVATVAVAVGDQVSVGDVVVELSPESFDNAIRQAEEQLERAEQGLNIAEQNRSEPETPEQLATRLEAEQRVRDAERALTQAEENKQKSLILAPEAGTVLEVHTSDGATISAGVPVVTIANLRNMKLDIQIDEIDIPLVTSGMPATFRLDAYPAVEIEGVVQRLSPVAQTSGGATTFPATIEFDAPEDLLLRPGMNANVRVQTAVRENVLLVPEQALRTVGNRVFVEVVNGNDTEEREIVIGLRSQGMVEVASGLMEGEQVVLR